MYVGVRMGHGSQVSLLDHFIGLYQLPLRHFHLDYRFQRTQAPQPEKGKIVDFPNKSTTP